MFKPQRVIFEAGVMQYPIAKEIESYFKNEEPKVTRYMANSNKIKSLIPGEDLSEQYVHGKKTLVVGIKKSLKFQSCKPSAHYQLPLVSGCMGQCEYCYLNTQLGDKPFVKVHVNVDEILDKARQYIEERLPDITIFEGAATSDPVPVEPYTGALKRCIEYFGKDEHSRFRFVTKYTDVDSLIGLEHHNHTEIRFSLNTQTVINTYEHYTASADSRIKAASKLAADGYPVGFIIAPVFYYDNWKEEYQELLIHLKEMMPNQLVHPLTFEVISHRYTIKAKNRINQIFPLNTLPMNEEERTFKYGQFGYGKYMYPKEILQEMKAFFEVEIPKFFPDSEIKYII